MSYILTDRFVFSDINNGFSLDQGCYTRMVDAARSCYSENVPIDFDPRTTSLTMASYLYEW